MRPIKSFGERIADALVEDGLLSPRQVDELFELQKKEGTRLLKLILEKSYVGEVDMVVSMGRVLNVPPVNLTRIGIPQEIAGAVPREMATNHKVLPVSRLDNKLFLAMADPLNVLALDDVKRFTRLDVVPMIASERAILDKLNNLDSGRSRVKLSGRGIDLRGSFLPTVHGEKCVLRILDKTNWSASLDKLGLDQDAYRRFNTAVDAPHGLIMVTGPTGAGKTTTLYSALNELNSPEYNIITVEDPVEFQIPGINQVPTKKEIGLTFANALRSILRQDPDIVMIGEIRDQETAEIAVEAALTGHQVLSTMHCNDAPGAIA